MGSTNDAVSGFKAAMLDNGITPPDTLIGDSSLHRAHVEGDKAGTLNLAYVLHLDGNPAGWWQYFKTGVTGTWSASGKKQPMTAAMRKQIDYAKEVREAEQAKAHREAAEKVRWIWGQATLITQTTSHQYLVAKRIQAHGARLYKGALVIPLMDETGAIVNLQFINIDGTKRFLSGGRKKGCYFLLGGDGSKLLVAEGFATACSLREATGHCVFVAFDAGNLVEVAKVVRALYPNEEIIIAGDNDESWVGQKAAREAALACGGRYILPPTEGTDFNDFINAGGVVYG